MSLQVSEHLVTKLEGRYDVGKCYPAATTFSTGLEA